MVSTTNLVGNREQLIDRLQSVVSLSSSSLESTEDFLVESQPVNRKTSSQLGKDTES